MDTISPYILIIAVLWLASGGLFCAIEGTCHLLSTKDKFKQLFIRFIIGPLSILFWLYQTNSKH